MSENETGDWTDEEQEKVGAERDLIDERLRRIPELVRRSLSAGDGDPDETYDMLRNVAGSLQVLIVYLQEQQR